MEFQRGSEVLHMGEPEQYDIDKLKSFHVGDHDLNDLATKVVLWYLQSWGQDALKRAEAIGAAADWCGIEVYFNEGGDETVPIFRTEHPWKEFREEIDKCWPKGQFEWEVEAVEQVMLKYKGVMESREPKGLKRLISKIPSLRRS